MAVLNLMSQFFRALQHTLSPFTVSTLAKIINQQQTFPIPEHNADKYLC